MLDYEIRYIRRSVADFSVGFRAYILIYVIGLAMSEVENRQ